MNDDHKHLLKVLQEPILLAIPESSSKWKRKGIEMINQWINKCCEEILPAKPNDSEAQAIQWSLTFLRSCFDHGMVLGVIHNYPANKIGYPYNGEQIMFYSSQYVCFLDFSDFQSYFSKEFEQYRKFLTNADSNKMSNKTDHEIAILHASKIIHEILTAMNQIRLLWGKLRPFGSVFKAVNYLIPIHTIWKELSHAIQEIIIHNPVQIKEWQILFEQYYLQKWDLSQYFSKEIFDHQPELILNTEYFSAELVFEILSSVKNFDSQIKALIFSEESQFPPPEVLNKLEFLGNGYIDCTYVDLRSAMIPHKEPQNSESLFQNFLQNLFNSIMTLNKTNATLFIRMLDTQFDRVNFYLQSIVTDKAEFSPIIIKTPSQSTQSTQFTPFTQFSDSSKLQVNHEFLLCIILDKNQPSIFPLSKTFQQSYKDSQGIFELRGLRNRNPRFHKQNRPNLWYPIYIDPSMESPEGFHPVSLEASSRFSACRWPYNSQGKESVWRWGKPKCAQNIHSDDVDLSNVVAKRIKKDDWRVFEKNRKLEQKSRSLWYDLTENEPINPGINGFKDLLPITEKALQIGSDSVKDTIILDPWAINPTTFHAILRLNNLQHSSRSCVLYHPKPQGEDLFFSQLQHQLYGLSAELKQINIEKTPIDFTESDSNDLKNTDDIDITENSEENLETVEESALTEEREELSDIILPSYPIVKNIVFADGITRLGELSDKLIDSNHSNTSYELYLNRIFQSLKDHLIPLENFELHFFHPYNLVEMFNYLLNLTIIQRRYISAKESQNLFQVPYFLVYGYRENEKVLIIWRDSHEFTLNMCQQEAKWLTEAIFPQFASHQIYINGKHAIPHVSSIEVIFLKLLSGIK